MKKIAAIGLLVLLLYNTFGLTIAILFFENDFKIASPVDQNDNWKVVKLYLPSLPYSETWESEDGMEGLLPENGDFYNATHILHQNDTLYVTLKSNLAARDRFFELANEMESLNNDKQLPHDQRSKTLALLRDLLKNYVPNSEKFEFYPGNIEILANVAFPLPAQITYTSKEQNLNTPPPELG